MSFEDGCQHESSSKQISPSDSSKREKPLSRNWQGDWPRTPGRVLGTSLIRLYQLTLSGFVGNSCRHLPTCSEYGYEAIARHGLMRGSRLTAIRLAKCGPGGTSGIDRVPEE